MAICIIICFFTFIILCDFQHSQVSRYSDKIHMDLHEILHGEEKLIRKAGFCPEVYIP